MKYFNLYFKYLTYIFNPRVNLYVKYLAFPFLLAKYQLYQFPVDLPINLIEIPFSATTILGHGWGVDSCVLRSNHQFTLEIPRELKGKAQVVGEAPFLV